MTTAPRRGVRLLVALATVAAVLCPAGPAAAHSELERSVPAQGESVTGPLDRVSLEFASALLDDLARVVVSGPDGTDLTAGPPQVVGGTVTQQLRPTSGGGPHRIAYRVVADDGHPISGTVEFALAAPVAAPSPATTPPAATAPAATAPAATLPATAEPSPSAPSSAAGGEAAGGADDGPAAGAWVVAALVALGLGALVAARRGSAARRTAST